MDAIAQDRFDCGWNDIAHGINTWTPSDKWASALAWAINMRGIAEECKPGSNIPAYYNGVIAACDYYQENGEIVRHVRRSTMEINELVA